MMNNDEIRSGHDRLMRIDEVAAYLQVPVKTLYRWRHHGTGPPAIRVGKHLRYRQRDLEKYLDGLQERGATAEGVVKTTEQA